MKFLKHLKILLPLTAAIAVGGLAFADHHKGDAKGKKKIKALMITGEGYHDYEKQKKIISEGTAKRLDIDWTILHHKTAEACREDLSKKGWADKYDIVVYNSSTDCLETCTATQAQDGCITFTACQAVEEVTPEQLNAEVGTDVASVIPTFVTEGAHCLGFRVKAECLYIVTSVAL